jgi:hypothetical protein
MRSSSAFAMRYFLIWLCVAGLLSPASAAENILESDLKDFARLIGQVEKLVKQKEPKAELKAVRKAVDKVRDMLKKGQQESALQEMKNVLLRLRHLGIKGLVQSCILMLGKMGGFAVEKKTGSGLHTVTFQTPEGRIDVYLPDDMAIGTPISASVSAEDSVTGYTVQAGKEKIALREQKGWQIEGEDSSMHVVLLEELGSEVISTDVPWQSQSNEVEEMASSDEEVPPPEPVVDVEISYLKFRLPSAVQSGDTMAIEGPFDGDYHTSSVQIADITVRVLAESYQKTIVRVPFLQGKTRVFVQENNQRVSCGLQLAEKLETLSPLVTCRPLE